MKPFSSSILISALTAALLSSWNPLATQAIPINPTGGAIKDLAVHNVDTTKLDPNPPATKTLNGGANDVWTFTVTNGGTVPWTNFHVEVRPNAVLAGNLNLDPVRATGFSVRSPADFKTRPGGGIFGRPSEANLGPDPAIGIVPVGNSLMLSITVTNRGLIQNDYYLGVRPRLGHFPSREPVKTKGCREVDRLVTMLHWRN